MNDLEHFKQTFNKVGWFIPPYIPLRFLDGISQSIQESEPAFTQKHLEKYLALIYSPQNLSAMVTERYPSTPYVKDYKIIISEAIEAHFMGLNHVAVAGLMPVIEGAGKKLCTSRNLSYSYKKTTSIFINLATDCKNEAIEKNIGAVGEIISMMESFIEFTSKNLYINSDDYPLTDKTNRHGILHGVYTDQDYGEPINFYKSIAAIDFLCFVSAFRGSVSWMAPSQTKASESLSSYYLKCIILGTSNPNT